MGGDASHAGMVPGAEGCGQAGEMDSHRTRLRCPRTARVATSSSLRLLFPPCAPLRAVSAPRKSSGSLVGVCAPAWGPHAQGCWG